MNLDPEPRLSNGPGLFASLLDWARKVVIAVNERVTSETMTLGFAISIGATGYIKLPSWLGGLVLQWGFSNPGGSGAATISFPLAFPVGCRSVVATLFNASLPSGVVFTINVSATTASNFSVMRRFYSGGSVADAGDSFFWIAVGN